LKLKTIIFCNAFCFCFVVVCFLVLRDKFLWSLFLLKTDSMLHVR
jgi:hypothetical protein